MADLFISYATANRARAERVRAAQMARGVSCWIAPDDVVAGDFAKAINQAISEAKSLAVIISDEAARSPHVAREVALAADRRIGIMPVVFTDFRPQGALEYYLSGHQYINCSNAHFEKAMDNVAAAVRGDAPTPSPPLPRPRREINLLTVVSAVVAVLAAVTPLPVGAIARISIVAAALVLPVTRTLVGIREWPLVRLAGATLLLLLVCSWTLDRAALESVIRRKLTPENHPTRAVFYAPYGSVRGLQQRFPPNGGCDPINLPADTSLFDPGGPQSAYVVEDFVSPQIIEFTCTQPFTAAAVPTIPTSLAVWDDDLYRWTRRACLAIGGLSWAASCLVFWRRRWSRSA